MTRSETPAKLNISFRKTTADYCPELLFCWCITVDADVETAVSDIFIPELFYDFLFIQKGEITYLDAHTDAETSLPQQSLKTLHTGSLNLVLRPPLTLFGARFSVVFAELFWQEMVANIILPQKWINHPVPNLAAFTTQIVNTIQSRRIKKTITPMVSPSLVETDWLAAYSPRHKRRLYKSVFGLSRKEMQAIDNVHQFLAQSCDFTDETPRIVEHVNSEVFYDQPHLNNAFKKMTGLSPLAYFEAISILQDNLMAVSYNEISD